MGGRSPPYSRIQNALNAQYDRPVFERVKESIKYLVAASGEFKNLKVFGWGDMDFPDDIANYKDLLHYSHIINSLILQNIQKDIGLITQGNIDNYLTNFEERSKKFDLLSIDNSIREALEIVKKR